MLSVQELRDMRERAVKILSEASQSRPVGTRVGFSSFGWTGKGTVVGHDLNLHNAILIDVKVDGSDRKSSSFYLNEVWVVND